MAKENAFYGSVGPFEYDTSRTLANGEPEGGIDCLSGRIVSLLTVNIIFTTLNAPDDGCIFLGDDNDFCLIYDSGTDDYQIRNGATDLLTLNKTGDQFLAGDLQVDGGLIGIAADTNLISMAANALTVNGTLGSGAITATATITASAGNVVISAGILTQVGAGANTFDGTVQIDGTLTLGVNSTTVGVLELWDGPGGTAPAYIKFGTPNGTERYLFFEDDGTLKEHNAVPTANTDGNVVGAQT